MALDRFHDEEDDYGDDTPPRKSTNPALVIGLVLSGLLVGLVVCAGLAMFVFWAAPSPAPPRKAAAVDTGATKQVYTRDAFATLVVGKTKDEVLKILGQPESTNEGAESWRYLEVTTDPVTGKTDHSTTLWFDAHGRVERVSFP